MGFTEVITPAAEHWSFRPSPTQLAELLEHLRAEGWLRPEAEAGPGGLTYDHPSSIPIKIASTVDGSCLILYLEGGPGGRYPEDWPDGQLEFTPDLCEDVLVIDSPSAMVLPAGDYGLSLPCPSCEENLLPLLPATPEHGLLIAPQQCRACGRDLRPSDLALVSEGDRVEEAPFFRFGVFFKAMLNRPEPLTSVGPELMETFRALLGVPVRSTVVDD